MRGLWLRMVRLLRWRRSERELREELDFHLDMETEALVRGGVDRAEARRRALASFGGADRWREETRATRHTGWLEDAARDARHAARGLAHAPAFSLAALATITLGVGATTAIFSMVQGVLLAPLPYPEPDELVTVWMRNPAQNLEEDITSWPNFVDWREQATLLDGMATVRGASWALTGEGGDPEEVRGAFVSRGFFELVGAPLALGRPFRDEEVEGEAAAGVVVLSHELFARRFGADSTLVGRTVLLDEVPYEVVGVTAPGRAYPRGAQLWAPQTFSGGLEQYRESRGALWLPVIGRLSQGVELSAAQAEMDAVARRLEEAYPVNEGVGITLEPIQETLVGDVRTPLLMLLAAVTLVLLIAVVNVANLLLARGAARARELAVRLTLGAGRGRIVRQVLAESLVLGLTGAVAGSAVALVGVRALVGLAPTDLPRVDDVGVSAATLGFALCVAVGASLLFGLVPALQARRVEPGSQLREGARGSSAASLARLRGTFVVGQFGLALLLLVGAGLLGRSFLKLRAVDPGFEPDGVLAVRLALPVSRYPTPESLRGFHEELEARLGAVPGVTEVGAVSTLFLQALPNMGRVAIEGRPELYEENRDAPVVSDVASPGFFAAAGMRLLSGRVPGRDDDADSPLVAVVNETFVRYFLDGVDPLGARFAWGSAPEDDGGWVTIVGVVADARRSGLDREVRPSAFLAASQVPPRRVDLLVRTASDPLSLAPAVADAVHAIDAQLPLSGVRTLEQAMSESLAPRRFVAWLLGGFAATALGLAAIGIFGVMAYLVGQRTREIGIRVALGAERSSVLGRILAEGMLHAGAGLLFGFVAAMALTRYLRSQLFGLAATDPATFALAAVLLLAVAAVACMIPARRAASVDPVVALRDD